MSERHISTENSELIEASGWYTPGELIPVGFVFAYAGKVFNVLGGEGGKYTVTIMSPSDALNFATMLRALNHQPPTRSPTSQGVTSG